MPHYQRVGRRWSMAFRLLLTVGERPPNSGSMMTACMLSLFQLVIEIFGIGVARIHVFGMLPVHVSWFYLRKVPFDVFRADNQTLYVAMIGKSEVDAACGTFGKQKIGMPLSSNRAFGTLHSTHSDAVEQVIVDVIHLNAFERIVVHRQRCLCSVDWARNSTSWWR